METLKEYAIKALVNTVDHLGSVTYKVNDLLDEKVDEVSGTELRVSCIEQVLLLFRFSNRRGFRILIKNTAERDPNENKKLVGMLYNSEYQFIYLNLRCNREKSWNHDMYRTPERSALVPGYVGSIWKKIERKSGMNENLKENKK